MSAIVQRLYSVVDVKAELYSPPFAAQNHGVATRMFQDLVNGSQEALPAKYPGDFKLVCIGEFDPSSGLVATVEHVTLGFGTEFVEKKASVAKIGGANG